MVHVIDGGGSVVKGRDEFTSGQVAGLFGVKPRTARRYFEDGTIPTVPQLGKEGQRVALREELLSYARKIGRHDVAKKIAALVGGKVETESAPEAADASKGGP